MEDAGKITNLKPLCTDEHGNKKKKKTSIEKLKERLKLSVHP